MGEATRDRQDPTNKSNKERQTTQKTQGWIRMHTDEDPDQNAKPTAADESKDRKAQSSDRKARELEKQVE